MKKDFILPVKLGVDLMKHLIVIGIVGNSEFEILEPQLFDDEITGKGIRVLRYRRNKKVDVYWQPGIKVDRNNFTLGDGLEDFEEAQFSKTEFEITKERVHLDICFTDKQNRPVKIFIDENPTSKKRMPFLAPVGNDIKKPTRLFLVYMMEFDFVLKKGTAIDISIGDTKLIPAGFPIPRNYKQVYFSRYSQQPAIGTLNASFKNLIVVENKSSEVIHVEGMNVEFDNKGEASRLFIENDKIIYEINFSPSFPDINMIRSGKAKKGKWEFDIAGVNLTGGEYSLNRVDNKIQFNLDVLKHWNPIGLPLSFRIFTKFVSLFRNWPSTYIWNSEIDLENITMEGNWRRKN